MESFRLLYAQEAISNLLGICALKYLSYHPVLGSSAAQTDTHFRLILASKIPSRKVRRQSVSFISKSASLILPLFGKFPSCLGAHGFRFPRNS